MNKTDDPAIDSDNQGAYDDSKECFMCWTAVGDNSWICIACAMMVC